MTEDARKGDVNLSPRRAAWIAGHRGDKASAASARDAADQILQAALTRGLSFRVTRGGVLTLAPPLTISGADLAHGLDIIEASILETPDLIRAA